MGELLADEVVADAIAAKELVVDEIVAVVARFVDDVDMSVDSAEEVVDENADGGMVLILIFRGATPLKAISARYSPSKILFDWRQFFTRFASSGVEFLSVRSIVQSFLL